MIDFLITYLGYPDSGAKKKAYIDPEIMETKRILKKTGINDNTLGWAHAYVKRFPNKETTKKLIKYYFGLSMLETKCTTVLRMKVKALSL